jgi:cytochrome d ubiquinol oxidase subunit I
MLPPEQISVDDPSFWHRLQFGFTIVYHYLFPQLTMGLAFIIVLWKWRALHTGDSQCDLAARFWTKIFGVNFVLGVVTGVPMEFQFGTNWARFSRYSAGVIGQTLAMEGMFAFFLESAFVAALVFGERKLSRRKHFAAACAVWAGSWLSGYFIVATNAFMQHPVGYALAGDGSLKLADFGAFLLNPWALAQYAHNMMSTVSVAAFVVAAVGAWYALRGAHLDAASRFLRVGVIAGLASSILLAFPTGDHQAKLVARHQPASLAAMEGRFASGPMAGVAVIGQPNVRERRLDNPIELPGMLSFLAFGTFHANVPGLNEFPETDWPDNIELLYYAFHVMAGIGTLMILLMLLGTVWLARGRLVASRPLLWAILLAVPFPYIATIFGWMTAELGRQPWLVYGLFRTAQGASPTVHSGTALFTLIGFCGIYFMLGLLFLFLVGRELAHGPGGGHGGGSPEGSQGEAAHA